MSVLIFAEQSDGAIRKSSKEAVSYGVALANQLGVKAEAVVLGSVHQDLSGLGSLGVSVVHHCAEEGLNTMDTRRYTAVMAEIAQSTGSQIIVFAHSITGRAIAPRLSARLKAGYISGATGLPDTSNGFIVRRNVFSGKAFMDVRVETPVKIISVNPNSFGVRELEGVAMVQPFQTSTVAGRVVTREIKKVTGQVPLGEAELVVSGGRGLKGPEHWGMVEDLAGLIGAATACSRAVADAHWRPHHEHVGQTGLAIAPNLYFAIGISGAIQHLAGVNRSKVIVVVNKDPEAPFFKAADYGIVGDAFEVMPKVIEAVRQLKKS
jgi:electron transfer flavoprotein alpha subunit